MGAVAILRGISPCYESTGVGSVASVETPSFVASSLPSGTVLYSGGGAYTGGYSVLSAISAGGSSYYSPSINSSLVGVVRRASGQVLVDFYEGRVGQGGAGRPGHPSPQPFTTDQGVAVFPNYMGTATVGESDMIGVGSRPSNPGPILVGGPASVFSAFGTADPAQFGSTILEESRAAATAYPSGSMSISASGDRKGIIASFIK